jgi:peptidoglycan/LPS O-acetylase OafA/YrhL
VLHLDLLRAAAILLVLGSHVPVVPPVGAWGHAWIEAWQRCGWAGVDLFFALSGYLIVGLLLVERHRTGTIDVKGFAWRRVFKIYPPYILFIAAAIAWSIRSGAKPRPAFAEFWPALVHLQNYIPVLAAPHLWSLAMEEHCYAMMLGVIVLAGRRVDPLRSRAIPGALAAIFMASWLGRYAYVHWVYAGTGPIGFTETQNRLDAVLAGSLAAWLVQRAHAGLAPSSPLWERWPRTLLAVSGACFVPTLTLEIYAHRPLVLLAILPLQAVGFALLLLGLARPARDLAEPSTVARRPSWPVRLLAFVGISSYSTYLWHWPFALELSRNTHLEGLDGHAAGPLVRVTVFVASAIVIGAISYAVIEKPALVWRRRWLARGGLATTARYADGASTVPPAYGG